MSHFKSLSDVFRVIVFLFVVMYIVEGCCCRRRYCSYAKDGLFLESVHFFLFYILYFSLYHFLDVSISIGISVPGLLEVPINRVEELLGLLVSPVRSHDERDHGERGIQQVKARSRHVAENVVPVLIGHVPEVALHHVAQVKRVHQDNLIYFPRTGFLHSGFEQDVAEARKRCAHLQDQGFGAEGVVLFALDCDNVGDQPQTVVHDKHLGAGAKGYVRYNYSRQLKDKEADRHIHSQGACRCAPEDNIAVEVCEEKKAITTEEDSKHAEASPDNCQAHKSLMLGWQALVDWETQVAKDMK